MTPTARPVRSILLGSALGAACGAFLYVQPIPSPTGAVMAASEPASAIRPAGSMAAATPAVGPETGAGPATAAWLQPPAATGPGGGALRLVSAEGLPLPAGPKPGPATPGSATAARDAGAEPGADGTPGGALVARGPAALVPAAAESSADDGARGGSPAVLAAPTQATLAEPALTSAALGSVPEVSAPHTGRSPATQGLDAVARSETGADGLAAGSGPVPGAAPPGAAPPGTASLGVAPAPAAVVLASRPDNSTPSLALAAPVQPAESSPPAAAGRPSLPPAAGRPSLRAEPLALTGTGGPLLASTHSRGSGPIGGDVLMDAPLDPPDLDIDPDALAAASGEPITLSLAVASGDTLMGLLLDQDIPRSDAYAAIEALRPVFDPRDIRPGIALDVTLRPGSGDSATFEGLSFEPTTGTTVSLARAEDGGFKAEKQQAVLVRRVVRHDGPILSSLFEAGIGSGATPAALAEMIRIFSYDVDFQRDIRKGDHFDLFYEQLYTEDGRLVRTGDLLYAAMTLSGRDFALYRFQDADGVVDYYNEKGEGVRKALLRTPINGARLSSGYGMRKHPILGYSKMHKGVDFAAPPGTPIYAAGDGVIESAGVFGGYGNYVRIRHNRTFKTAYGHMMRFAKGIASGTRVKQGQVIGYVGSTGRSTGPHLHYEILENDRHVNPMQVRFPSGKTLEGKELAAFKKERDRIQLAFENTPSGTKVASAR